MIRNTRYFLYGSYSNGYLLVMQFADQQKWRQFNLELQSSISTFYSSIINEKLRSIPMLCRHLHSLNQLLAQLELPFFINKKAVEQSKADLLKLIKAEYDNPLVLTALMNSWYLYCHQDMLGDIVSHFIGLLNLNSSALWMVKSMLRGLFMHAIKVDKTLLPIITPIMINELNVDGQEVMRQVKIATRAQQSSIKNMQHINPSLLQYTFPDKATVEKLQQDTSHLPLVVKNKIVMDVLRDIEEEKFQSIVQKALQEHILDKFISITREAPVDPRARIEEEQDLDIFDSMEIDNTDALDVLLEELLSYSEYFTDFELECWKSLSSLIFGQQLNKEDTSIVLKLQDQVHVLLKMSYFLFFKKNDLYEPFVHLVLENNIKNAVKFISEIPYISDATLQLIGTLSESEFDTLAILHEIINVKPKQRNRALKYLLACCKSTNKVIRAHSISLCKSFQQSQIVQVITSFAITQFKELQIDNLDGTSTELFLSLLMRDASLLNEFIIVYNSIEDKSPLTQLLLIYTQQLESVDHLITQFVPVATQVPDLLIALVQQQKENPSELLLTTIKQLINDKFTPKVLHPVLHAYPRDTLIEYLPCVFNIEEEDRQSLVNCLTRVLMTIGENNTHKLTPSELLLQVHVQEDKIADKTSALADVLDLSEVHTEPILTATLKELSKLDKIPELTMITVQFCIDEHDKMTKYITSEFMGAMVSKMIWKYDSLWHSFKHICEITQPHCCGVILNLPVVPFKELMEDKPSVKNALKKLIGNSQHLRESKRIRPLLPLLGTV